MPVHHRHVLEVAFPALVADRAIVRMAGHQPFGHGFPKCLGLGIVDRDADPSSAGVRQAMTIRLSCRFVFELLDSALAAGAHRSHGRMPAEIGNVEAQGSGMRPAGSDRGRPRMAGYRRRSSAWKLLSSISSGAASTVQGHALVVDVPHEIVPEVPQSTLQRLHRARGQVAEACGPACIRSVCHLQQLKIVEGAPPLLDGAQQTLDPVKPLPARSAPAARFLGVELLQIAKHPHGTRPVIEHDDRSRCPAGCRPFAREASSMGVSRSFSSTKPSRSSAGKDRRPG